ncbi:MAG: carbohydrate porin [Verrucomicrobia bacterium]|nr:carbohydrate porin [Verrucomicrobiota bacterium]
MITHLLSVRCRDITAGNQRRLSVHACLGHRPDRGAPVLVQRPGSCTLRCWGLVALSGLLATARVVGDSFIRNETNSLEAGAGVRSIWEQTRLAGDWGGARDQLETQGVVFGLTYTGEVLSNISGGIRRGLLYEGLLELSTDINFDKLTGWWSGGSLHINSFWTHGPSLSSKYTGNLLTASNIDAYDTWRLYELWHQQDFLDGKVSLRLGQLAADEEFAVSEYGSLFLNGTLGWPAMISANAPSPAYAIAAPGARLRVDPTETVCVQTAFYDGHPDPTAGSATDPSNLNNSGTRFQINEREGFFSVHELAYKLNHDRTERDLPGAYKAGGWYHDGTFQHNRLDNLGVSLADTLNSSGVPHGISGNCGLYLVAEQMIYRKAGTDDQGIGLFWRGGGSPPDRNVFEFYSEGGCHGKGLIPDRDRDVFGVAAAYAQISRHLRDFDRDRNTLNETDDPVRDFEMVLEFTYLVTIAAWWTVQPDLQWILHPGGSSATGDALVVGVRTKLDF